ncbi:hypothetical protein [Aquimarina aquimarini]|uniref:hypothetical protein n=1 Tax=Aquimarina aquimarini TaxID=1191734 RepID=UPI000D554859|nr:hypothetical protein [Aquimarina aquimarini]
MIHSYLSDTQEKAVRNLGFLALLLLILGGVRYYVSEYTPDTEQYTILWKTINWLFSTLIFGWYFYKNKKYSAGILIQLLFIPFYILKVPLYYYIDYHTNFDNSYLIYKTIYGITLTLPVLWFALRYLKCEKQAYSIKTMMRYSVFSMIAILLILSNLNGIFKYLQFVTFDPPYIKDIFYGFILCVRVIKLLCIFIGFLYMSNKLVSIKQLMHPIPKSVVTKRFFGYGSIVSYTLIFITFLGIGKEFISINFSFSDPEYIDIFKHFANIITLILSAVFLGNLIQYRGYSLKKYFGIVGTLSLLPVLNSIVFLIFTRSQKSKKSIHQYYSKLGKNTNIHLTIFSILFALYSFIEKDEIVSVINILIMIIVVLILSTAKKNILMISTTVAILFLGIEFYEYREYSDVFKLFKEKIITILCFALPSLVAIYYSLYYVLHKSFYTDKKEGEQFFEEFQSET